MPDEKTYPQIPQLESLILDGCEKGVFPGAAVAVSRDGELVHVSAAGSAALTPEQRPATLKTVFDVASLTKVMAATAACMELVREKKLDLETPLADFFDRLKERPLGKATVLQLLTHSSGLPAWKPYFEAIAQAGNLRTDEARREMFSKALDENLEAAPGARMVYSDVGFLVLTAVIEKAADEFLDIFCRKFVFEPLRMRRTFFIDLGWEKSRFAALKTYSFAATEDCPWRKRILVGEVHDDNSYAAGGVCGHAGVFSTALEVHRFCLEMLKCSEGKGSLFPAEVVNRFWTVHEFPDGGRRAVGWDVPSAGQTAAGRFASTDTVGHLGFTGCSLWIDRKYRLVMVLLTNRVHPTRANEKIKEFRPVFHEEVYKSLGLAGL